MPAGISELELDVEATISALGYVDESGNYCKEFDCNESVEDLIRFLRRDNAATCNVRRMLGRAGIVASDLIPLLVTYPDQHSLTDSVLKLLLNVSQPTWLCFEAKGKEAMLGVAALVQEADAHLRTAKKAFVNHQLLAVLQAKVSVFMDKAWEDQTDAERLTSERILLLIRNILHIPCHAADVHVLEGETTVQDQLIKGLGESGWLQLLIRVASEGEATWQMHFLDIAHLLLREHDDPRAIASAGQATTAEENARESQDLARFIAHDAAALRQKARNTSTRHSRFAGSYLVTGVRHVGSEQRNGVVAHKLVKDPNRLDWIHNRKKIRGVPKNRRPAVAPEETHRSSLPIRRLLREFCVSFLETAFSDLMKSLKSHLSRNRDLSGGRGEAEESYYLWALRWYPEFCRVGKLPLKLVRPLVTLTTFHHVHTQLEQYLEMGMMEKRGPDAVAWGQRTRLALRAYSQLLHCLQLMLRDGEVVVRGEAKSILEQLFYLPEYRDLLPSLLKRYNPIYLSKAYLRDLVETTHLYLRLLEKQAQKQGDDFRIQQKKRKLQRKQKKKQKAPKVTESEEVREATEEELVEAWDKMSTDLCDLLQGHGELPTEDVIPYDALMEGDEDVHKRVAMWRVQKALREQRPAHAVALYRAARACFPQEDIFGAAEEEPEAEFLQLQEIHMTSMPDPEPKRSPVEEEPEEEDFFADEMGGHSESEGETKYEAKEAKFDFLDYVQHQLVRPDILHWYVWLLEDFVRNSVELNHAIVKLFHRVAFDIGLPATLYQLRLFAVFHRIANTPPSDYIPDADELLGFSRALLRGFLELTAVDAAERRGTLWPWLLFWKNKRHARVLQTGTDDAKAGKEPVWPEELEMELRTHYEEYHALEEQPKDLTVLDWCMANLSKKRNLKQIQRALKGLGYSNLPIVKKNGLMAADARPKKPKKVKASEEHIEEVVNAVGAGEGDIEIFAETYFAKLLEREARRKARREESGPSWSSEDSDGEPIAPVFQKPKKRKRRRPNTGDDLFDDGRSSESSAESDVDESPAHSPPSKRPNTSRLPSSPLSGNSPRQTPRRPRNDIEDGSPGPSRTRLRIAESDTSELSAEEEPSVSQKSSQEEPGIRGKARKNVVDSDASDGEEEGGGSVGDFGAVKTGKEKFGTRLLRSDDEEENATRSPRFTLPSVVGSRLLSSDDDEENSATSTLPSGKGKIVSEGSDLDSPLKERGQASKRVVLSDSD